MTTHFEIQGRVVVEPTSSGNVILLSVPMKKGDRLKINGLDVTLPEHGEA